MTTSHEITLQKNAAGDYLVRLTATGEVVGRVFRTRIRRAHGWTGYLGAADAPVTEIERTRAEVLDLLLVAYDRATETAPVVEEAAETDFGQDQNDVAGAVRLAAKAAGDSALAVKFQAAADDMARALRVRKIAAQVEGGTYSPDPDAVADALARSGLFEVPEARSGNRVAEKWEAAAEDAERGQEAANRGMLRVQYHPDGTFRRYLCAGHAEGQENAGDLQAPPSGGVDAEGRRYLCDACSSDLG